VGSIGDRNKTFFHVVATQRRWTNMMVSLQDEAGHVVVHEDGISRVLVRYYMEMYKTRVGPKGEILTQAYTYQFSLVEAEKIPERMGPWLTRVRGIDEVRETTF
jgi:hypothetical protein